ncbi:TPA: hypothetical protein ACGO1T_000528 [Streptococcus suis]
MTRKKIERDTEIYVSNNIYSSFSYSDDRGASLDLTEHGDEDSLTFGELKSLASGRGKAALQKMYLLITDVADPEIELDDVVRQLKLEKYYNKAKELFEEKDNLSVDSFSDFLINGNLEKIKQSLEDDYLRAVIVETAVHLYSKNKIQDNIIIPVLQAIGIEDVYSYIGDIKAWN